MKQLLPYAWTCLMLFPLAFANAQPTETEKQRLDLAFAIATATSARYGGFKLPGEYAFGKDNKLIGQKFTSNAFTYRYTVSNEGTAQLEYFGATPIGVTMKRDDCNTENIRFDKYNYKFNGQNKVTRIEEKTYAGYRQKFQKRYYVLEYDNNKVSKVSAYMIVAEGANASNPRPVFEYITDMATYTWKNNDKELTIVSVEYMDRKDVADKEAIRQTTETWYQVEKNRLFAKVTINNKPETSNETLITPQKVTVIASNISYGSSEKKLYTIDSKKRIVQETTESFNKDKLLERKNDIFYTYTLREPNLPQEDNCSYTVTNKSNIYDGTGKLVEERDNGKFRRKAADGTWSEWKFYSY